MSGGNGRVALCAKPNTPHIEPGDGSPIDLRILNLFAAERAPLLLYPSDVARRLGANRTAVYRAMGRMARDGWLLTSELSPTTAYRLGPKLLRLQRRAVDGALHEVDLALRSLAAMGDVIRRCGEQAQRTDHTDNTDHSTEAR